MFLTLSWGTLKEAPALPAKSEKAFQSVMTGVNALTRSEQYLHGAFRPRSHRSGSLLKKAAIELRTVLPVVNKNGAQFICDELKDVFAAARVAFPTDHTIDRTIAE